MHDSHVCRAEPETILPVNPSQTNLIDISPLLNTHLRQTLASFFRKSIDRFFMIPEFNTLYKKLADMDAPAFFEKSLETLDIKYRIDPADLKRIPTNGPLVIIGNHPFGGLEGIIAGDILARRRPDVKILGNYLLQQIAPIRDCVIPVDPFGTQTSTRNNIRGLRKAFQWLKSGGTVITFPAGEVAHMNLRKGRVADPVWSDHISSLIRKTDAKVMPLYFPGKNSRCFQCLGMIHPRLRTAMLPREVLNKRGSLVIRVEDISIYLFNSQLLAYKAIMPIFPNFGKKGAI